jgi:hypothetical protein
VHHLIPVSGKAKHIGEPTLPHAPQAGSSSSSTSITILAESAAKGAPAYINISSFALVAFDKRIGIEQSAGAISNHGVSHPLQAGPNIALPS